MGDHRLDLDETDLAPIVRLVVGDSVDRRGNLTCLAVTNAARIITLGYTTTSPHPAAPIGRAAVPLRRARVAGLGA